MCIRDSFIPAAVELAFRVNTGVQKKFVWTVGSYLIRYYLEHAKPDACARLEQAIRAGFIRWHGLACTTHTELMDRRLLDYDLSISQALDRRFGVTTLAAKMTDVPGHTIGLVPALSNAGIEFLHIGVNASSRVPSCLLYTSNPVVFHNVPARARLSPGTLWNTTGFT